MRCPPWRATSCRCSSRGSAGGGERPCSPRSAPRSAGRSASTWESRTCAGCPTASTSRPGGSRSRRPGSNPSEFHVVSFLRLVPRKRPFALVEALARVRDGLPAGVKLRATIAGDGFLRPFVERLVRRRGLAGQVYFPGWLAVAELQRVLATAHVFLMASIREAFGISLAEACSAGVPVVARNAWGPPCFIQQGREGLLADSDEQLAEHVLRLAREPSLRLRIAAHNRSHPLPFDWQQVLALHLAVYQEAIARRSGLKTAAVQAVDRQHALP
ncbi:MAG: glycosyltransferase [Myxococcales bacterium]